MQSRGGGQSDVAPRAPPPLSAADGVDDRSDRANPTLVPLGGRRPGAGADSAPPSARRGGQGRCLAQGRGMAQSEASGRVPGCGAWHTQEKEMAERVNAAGPILIRGHALRLILSQLFMLPRRLRAGAVT